MLTADAFGVLPPISKMTPEQAMYHFLSGYTAKLAGTEKGLGKEPVATFSACFGAPFMALHPSVYAKMLGEKIAEHEVDCWLVNTGWTGGPHGVGAAERAGGPASPGRGPQPPPEPGPPSSPARAGRATRTRFLQWQPCPLPGAARCNPTEACPEACRRRLRDRGPRGKQGEPGY